METKKNPDTRSLNPVPYVLVCVILLLVVLTVYIAIRPASPSGPQPRGQVVDEERRVLEIVDGLLGVSSRIDSRAIEAARQQAIDLMYTYVKANSRDVNVRLQLIDTLMLGGRNDEAVKVVDDLLRVYPLSSEALWRKGELLLMSGEDGAELFAKAAASPDASPAIWSRFGCELMSRGDHEQAAQWLEKGYEGGSRDGWSLLALGELALSRQRVEEATGFFKQAVKDPAAPLEAWLTLAKTLKYQGQLDEALEAIRGGMMADRSGEARNRIEYGEMQLMLAQIYTLQRRRNEAADAYIEAGRFEPLRPEAYVGAARCLYYEGNYSQAMRYIDLAHHLLPEDPTVNEWRTRIEDARFPRKVDVQVDPTSPLVPVGQE